MALAESGSCCQDALPHISDAEAQIFPLFQLINGIRTAESAYPRPGGAIPTKVSSRLYVLKSSSLAPSAGTCMPFASRAFT